MPPTGSRDWPRTARTASGKTTACVKRALRSAIQTPPMISIGVRRYVLAVWRETYQQLWGTMIKSWRKVLDPDKGIGTFTGSFPRAAEHVVEFEDAFGKIQLIARFMAFGADAEPPMSIAVQRRRGTAAEHASFVGFPGELTIVTDDWSLRIHDGVTPGGHSYGASSGLQPAQNLADLADADTALVNLGGSAIGRNLFKAGNDEAARDLLGLNTMALEQVGDFYAKTAIDNLEGKKLRVDAEQSFSSEEKECGLGNLGASALGIALLQGDDVDAALDALGAGPTGKALLGVEDADEARVRWRSAAWRPRRPQATCRPPAATMWARSDLPARPRSTPAAVC